jgi:hypothetical protein
MKLQRHPLYLLDVLGHMLHLPNWVVCDRFDAWVMRTSEPGEPVKRNPSPPAGATSGT